MKKPRLTRKTKAIILLVLLAPLIPELTTGSTPFWNILNPIVLIFLAAVYGIPCLIYREYMVWRKIGYSELLFLGLIEGIFIEGVVVNTFYNPALRDEYLSTYGRLLGVNWPWTIYLTIFHSIFSVLLPIMIIDSLYPDLAGQHLLQPRRLEYLAPIPLLAAIIFAYSPDTYLPQSIYTLASITAIAVIWVLVDTGKTGWIRRIPRRLVIPPKYFVAYPIIFLIVLFFISSRILHPIVHILLGIISYLILLRSVDTIHRINNRLEVWRASRNLLAGMNITGIITAVLNPNLLYVLVPNTASLIILVLLSKKMSLKSPNPHEEHYEGSGEEG